MEISKAELQTSSNYWYAHYIEKTKSIDKLCVKSAERINKLTYAIEKLNGKEDLFGWHTERRTLEDILIHFHGFVDIEYVKGHDLEPESILRHKNNDYYKENKLA